MRVRISHHSAQANWGSTLLPWIVKKILLLNLLRGQVTFHCLLFPEVRDSRELSFYIKSKTSKHLHRNEKIFHNGQFERCRSYSLSLTGILWESWLWVLLSKLPNKSALLKTFKSVSMAWKLLPQSYDFSPFYCFKNSAILPAPATPTNPLVDVNSIRYWKTW